MTRKELQSVIDQLPEEGDIDMVVWDGADNFGVEYKDLVVSRMDLGTDKVKAGVYPAELCIKLEGLSIETVEEI